MSNSGGEEEIHVRSRESVIAVYSLHTVRMSVLVKYHGLLLNTELEFIRN